MIIVGADAAARDPSLLATVHRIADKLRAKSGGKAIVNVLQNNAGQVGLLYLKSRLL